MWFSDAFLFISRSPSPEDGHSPKRRKLNMQKALSLNTVLRCVDAKHAHGNQVWLDFQLTFESPVTYSMDLGKRL